MSRPKYWWYDYVKKSIMHSVGTGTAPETLQESISDMAVKKVLARTKGQYRGEERLKMIDLVYKKRQHSVPGAYIGGDGTGLEPGICVCRSKGNGFSLKCVSMPYLFCKIA